MVNGKNTFVIPDSDRESSHPLRHSGVLLAGIQEKTILDPR
jgi:hypothetical protein